MNTNCRKPGRIDRKRIGRPSLYFLLITLFFTYPGTTARAQLIGMTSRGGDYDHGIIFQTTTSGADFTTRYHMRGSCWGGFTKDRDGMLYALAVNGGANDRGFFFKFNPATFEATTIIDFDGAKTGSGPNNSLMLASNGKLYGMTISGGIHDYGTIFEYDPQTGTFDKMVDIDVFSGPVGRFTQAANGRLYAMTVEGGQHGAGSIIEYVPGERTYTIKVALEVKSMGQYPRNGLVLGKDGNLYGTASGGGPSGSGTLFAYVPGGSDITVKHVFGENEGDGSFPRAVLTATPEGKIYGTTAEGGEDGYGTLFVYDPATGSYQKLYDLTWEDGATPHGAMTLGDNGKLYGTTYQGGVDNGGTLFEYDPATTTYTVKTQFVDIGVWETVSDLVNISTPVPAWKEQTIKFGTLSARTLGDAQFALEATASSGLKVSYATGDPNIATITDGLVTLVGAGKVTITASQEGGKEYLAAKPVSQSFCVNPVAAITMSLDNQSAPVLTSNVAPGNQWFREGKAIEGATAQKFNVLLPGLYTLQVSTGECVSALSKPVALIVTGTEQAAEGRALKAYPNPAAEAVEIEFTETGSKHIEILTLDGRIMTQASTTGSKTSVDVRQYKTGIYLVKARSSQGVQYIRFTKQ